MFAIYKDVYRIVTKDNKTWENTCFKYVILIINSTFF